MEITREVLDQEIANAKNMLRNAEASVNNITGVLTTLENMRRWMDIEPQAPATPEDFISDANAEIQARDEARMQAYSQPDYSLDYYNNYGG